MTASSITSPNHLSEQKQNPGLKILPVKNEAVSTALHLVAPEGQLQVHTASYRGSFSGVLSEALRAAGLGRRVIVAQFLRGGVDQGVKGGISLCGKLKWLRPAISSCLTEKAFNHTEGKDSSLALLAVEEIWQICKEHLLTGNLDQLVLDEIGLAIALDYLNEEEVISTLDKRPRSMDVILTGPSIPSRVMEMADQVTELRCSF